MNSTKPYQITCLNCDGARSVMIHSTPVGDRVDWKEDGGNHKIISARKRLDDQWGFECTCGNNDLMTAQEKRAFTNSAAPTPKELSDVANDLRIEPVRFNLEEL